MGEADVDKLPDPDLFRDALVLARAGRWSPRDLDETDALLLAVVTRITNTRTRRG